MAGLRGRPEVNRDSRVEIVKVKMRSRNRKVPLPVISDLSKHDEYLPQKLFAETSVVTPLQQDTPDSGNQRQTQDQFDYDADLNGNLSKETTTCGISPSRNRSPMKAKESVVFSDMKRMASSTSNLSLVKPSNIPVERFPQEENFIDIAVAEVVSPSKLYVNMASSYDKLNKMMDEIDNFYEKLLREEGLSKRSTKWAKMRETITDGEYVAVMWIDQMWYRARVRNFVNHTELRVFYIDYGTTRVVRLHQMYPLDARFFNLPAQAIEVSLAGIEPPCDDKDTVMWTKEATKRVVELTAGSHEMSLVAIVTVAAKKPGLWILNHQDNGVNEILVEEGFAKFVEGEEILSTSTEPDIVKIVDRTRTLLEEVLAEHDNPSKVETLMVRSKSLYEQLLFLVEN